MSNLTQTLDEISRVYSRDTEWLKGYFHMQWNGINELLSEPYENDMSDIQAEKFNSELIQIARHLRKTFMTKFPNLVFFGRYTVMEIDN